MKLILGWASEIDNPTPDMIQSCIESAPAHDNDAFLILERDEMNYMQTSKNESNGFVLEYQEGGIHAHYQSIDAQLGSDLVVRAFVAYSRGTDSWRDLVSWQRLDLE